MMLKIIKYPSNFAQAHIKSALIGASVTIPIKDGNLVSSQSFASYHIPPHNSLLVDTFARPQEHGRESGTWSLGQVNTSDASWRLFREKRHKENL
jgi:hypothetical protein